MKRACIYSSLPLLVVLLLASCRKEVFTGKREARGVWMSRFEYTGTVLQKDPEAAKAYIRSVFEKARKAKFNMVFFQVRGNATSFYNSSFEPWAAELTGVLGKDPGWDPLQFAIGEAHRLGLELHAWINTFPIWRGETLPVETTPLQPLLAHPEWVVCDEDGKPMTMDAPKEGYIWASPGIPAVRQHILDVVMDIVSKYDVDGVHFDYIRYPEESPSKGYSHDSISVARFNSAWGNPFKLAWEHWQREQINEFVFDAYNAIIAAKPWVKVSAAVVGKYMGSGWNSYSVVYQDPRAWMELGKIDFIVPMVYWERSHPTHPFDPLIAQWQDRVAYDRYILPGLSTGLIAKAGWEELSAEIQDIRQKGLPGVVFFSAGGLDQIWDPPPEREPLCYVIYRSHGQRMSIEDVSSIVSITGRDVTSFVDAKAPEGEWYYAVTAVDRLGNESALSAPVPIRVPTMAARAGTPNGESRQSLRLARRERVWQN